MTGNPTRGREAIERDLHWAREVATRGVSPQQRDRGKARVEQFEKELEDFNATQ